MGAVAIAFVAVAGACSVEAAAQSSKSSSHAKGLYSETCGGHCAVTVYAGKFVSTDMERVFGIDGYTPPWEFDLDDSYLVGGALSRRIASFADVWDIEAEVGLAKRFGDMDETETWAALYFRWTAFPWNDYLVTTIAVSTGFSYASDVNEIEERRGDVPGGSRLLHFLSPEITFALPSAPDWELVTRFHHRSGGGEFILGDTELFKGVDGGAQFITTGVRHRF